MKKLLNYKSSPLTINQEKKTEKVRLMRFKAACISKIKFNYTFLNN